MISLLLPLLALIVGSQGQACEGDFSSYLQCLKNELDSDYSGLEVEFQDDFRTKLDLCFSETVEEAREEGLCTLFPSEIQNGAFGNNGPLRSCRICQTVAKFLKNAFLGASPRETSCMREVVRKAIAREMEPCIKSKLDFDFEIPELPDFDEEYYPSREDVIESAEMFIIAHSRLEFCQRNEARHAATTTCLNEPFKGYYDQHCGIIKGCRNTISSSCSERFAKAQKATCECVAIKRNEVKERVRNIRHVVSDAIAGQGRSRRPSIGEACTTPSCHCVEGIKAQLKSSQSEVDWKEVVGESMTACLDSPPRFGVDKLLEIGCRRATKLQGKGLRELVIGFNFIQNLLDAMVERVNRFCDGPHCA